MDSDKPMREQTKRKLAQLREYLDELESALICYSGGVDSSFLLAVALGEYRAGRMKNVEAVYFRAPMVPKSEESAAFAFAESVDTKLNIIDINTLEDPQVALNPENRCYLCKSKMLNCAIDLAKIKGFFNVAEGSQTDDLRVYRPGRQAVKELGVKSPLEYVGFDKSEVREAARVLGLSVWSKPAYSCLMTRFLHGELVTTELLHKVEKAEDFLRKELRYHHCRLRHHGDVARLELGVNDAICAMGKDRDELVSFMTGLGYQNLFIDIASPEGTTTAGTKAL